MRVYELYDQALTDPLLAPYFIGIMLLNTYLPGQILENRPLVLDTVEASPQAKQAMNIAYTAMCNVYGITRQDTPNGLVMCPNLYLHSQVN